MADASEWVPMRRPPAWSSAVSRELLRGTPVNRLLDGAEITARPLADARSSVGRSAPVLSVAGNVWPGIKRSRDPKAAENEDRVEAGPTGVPWVNSNGWIVRLARTLVPHKPVWIVQDPPENGPLPAESYLLAVADAAAYGGRWVVSLDDDLARGLAARANAAASVWRRIAAALSFFESHRAWRAYVPRAVLGVLSDFTGPNEFLATELLNLIPRRHLPYLILEKSKTGAPPFAGLKAIVYPDQDPPASELRSALMRFAETGGAVISPLRSAALADGLQAISESYPRYRIYAAGKGRVAAAKDDQTDPYMVAADAHTLLSRAHDLVRVWNGGPANTYYTESPDGRNAVVHVLSYIRRPVREMTLQVRRPYRSARLWTLESAKPQPLPAATDGGAIEIHLPPVSVYAAVELDA